MNDQPSEPSEDRRFPIELLPGQLMIMRILWGAFIATQALFAFVFVLGQPPEMDAEQAMAMLPIFAALSLMMAGGSLFGAPIIAARTAMDFTTMTLLRFALAESIGIFGLTLGFMGVDGAYVFPFMVAGAAVILVQVPNQTNYQRYRKDVLRQRR